MTFEEITAPGKVALVEFYASWCPHCRRMMPVVDQVRELLSGRADVWQLDIDSNREAADAAGVQSIPSFLLYKDGKVVWRHTGEIEGETLLGEVEAVL